MKIIFPSVGKQQSPTDRHAPGIAQHLPTIDAAFGPRAQISGTIEFATSGSASGTEPGNAPRTGEEAARLPAVPFGARYRKRGHHSSHSLTMRGHLI